jgi:CHAT domain-containing protein
MKKYFVVSLFLFSSLVGYGQPSKGSSYFQEAKDWLDKGNTAKAIKSFLSSRAEYLKEGNYYRFFVATQSLSVVFEETDKGTEAEKIILETVAIIPKTTEEQLELHAKLQDNLAYTYLNSLNQPDKAIAAYTESISIYEKTGKASAKETAFELTNRALAYQQILQIKASADDLVKSISIYEKNKDTSLQELIDNYYSLGQNYAELKEFELGLTSLEKGLMLIEPKEKSEQHAQFYDAIGSLFQKQGKYEKAIKNYELAKDINETIFGKDADNYGQSLTKIGSANKDMGDWEAALLNYQEVLTIYQKTPPKELSRVVDIMLDISRITDALGMFQQSKIINEQALTFATNFVGKNSMSEVDVYRHLAVVAYNDGEYDVSLTYNFKTLSMMQAINYQNDGYYAEIYDAIGQAYDGLNDVTLAVKYKQQAMELFTKTLGNTHPLVAMELGNIGLSSELASDLDEALKYLHQSLATLLKSPAATEKEIGITYLDVGRLYLKKKQTKDAIGYLEKARVIFDDYVQEFNKVKVYNELGIAYYLLNETTKAEQCFRKALQANAFISKQASGDLSSDQSDYLDYYELITTYISIADLLRNKNDQSSLLNGLNQLDAADKVLKATAISTRNPKDRLELARLNEFFTESGMQLTDKLYAITHNRVYLEKAFYYSERNKANELFADIEINKATALSRMPKKILDRKSEIAARLNTLRQQIASAYAAQNQPLIVKLKALEFDLTKEHQEIDAQIKKLAPAISTLSTQLTLPTWNEVQKQLDAKTVLVSYTITDSAKYILIGSKETLVIKKIDPKTNLDKMVRGFVNQIKFQSPSITQLASPLTNILWSPVEEALIALAIPNPEKIIIIPDGPLYYLPFEALGNDKFLVEKYTLHYTYSAALLSKTNRNVPKEKPSLIAMAPVFEDKETNFVTKSCERFVAFSRKADTTSRAFSRAGDYITPLPGTRSEIQKINQLHLEKGILSNLFLEEDANEEKIKKGGLENFDYIHLATHGFVNNQYPELSGLLLTQDSKSAEDGVLYTGEIVGLNLTAELVTLSACETALGKKIQGEGVRGLTTAFLFAGAKNVIASLWKVSDQSTSDLMIEFYIELLTGKNKATALRLAKLKLIKTENYNHPYYWAPFVQVGAN